MYECFLLLEKFAFWVGDNPFDLEYPLSPKAVVQTNCTNLVRAIMANRIIGECNNHFFHNSKNNLERILGWKNTLSPLLIVNRSKHNDKDFLIAMIVLGYPDPIGLNKEGSKNG